MPDEELTRCVQAGAPEAGPAMEELRRRHRSAVLAYARLAARNEETARQLAAQTFSEAAVEACRGIDPPGPWGYHLLLLVQRVADDRIANGQEARLAPHLTDWIEKGQQPPCDELPPGTSSVLRAAFRCLPLRTRGVLWYGVVEKEPASHVALFLGVAPASVPLLTSQALKAVRQAYLHRYSQDTDNATCRAFHRLIEAATEVAAGQREGDLDEHLSRCPCCRQAMDELHALRRDPGNTLAERLLGWGAAEYVTDCPSRDLTASIVTADLQPAVSALLRADTPSARSDGRADRDVSWVLPFLLLSLAVVGGVTVAFHLSDTGNRAPEAAVGGDLPPVPLPPAPSTPAATFTTEGPPDPAPSTPRPTRTPTPAPTASTSPSATVPPVLGGRFSPLVNAGSGLCLDVASPELAQRPDVMTAPCGGSRSQQWGLDERGLVHLGENPDFCLDTRGSTEGNVGIWPCNPIEGSQPQNLVFRADPSGSIRPLIAPGFELTPQNATSGSRVGLRPAVDEDGHRWTAGQGPAS